MQVVLPAALVLYGLGILLALFLAPGLLRWGALLALAIVVFELWERRISVGVGRRLPPGSLGFFRADAWRDPDYYMNQSNQHGPVFKFRHLTRPAVGIVGLERIGDFLRQHGDDLLVPPAPFDAIVPGGFVRYMSGQHHAAVAAMLRSAFTTEVMAGCDNVFATECRIALGAIQADSSSVVRELDSMVFRQMTACFLGIGEGDRRDRFEVLFERADYRQLSIVGQDRAREALLEITREMRKLVEQDDGDRRSFLLELATKQPNALRSDEVLANFAYALHTGRVDVAGLLTWLVAMMGENPAWTRQLRNAVEDEEISELRPGGLADRMVRETLRLRQSEFLMRRTKVPIAWGGFVIPRGWQVRLCIAESHRLPEMFQNPDRYDPDRFLLAPSRARYAPFGLAPHLCPGEHLTRAIGRHLAVELVKAFDLEVTRSTPWEFSGFHWRPSPRMSVKLQPQRSGCLA